MNIYDFDKTIYSGDSSVDFFLFCLKKNPRVIFSALKTIISIFQKSRGKYGIEKVKSDFFSFLKYFDDLENLVLEFWKKNEKKIESWFIQQKKNEDFVISASPEFLLLPICKKLNVNLIATKVDAKTGKLIGKNCKGSEKVQRFFEEAEKHFGSKTKIKIENFYSDSLSDLPLAKLSENAWLIKNGKITKWQN